MKYYVWFYIFYFYINKRCQENPEAEIIKVQTKNKSKWRPLPLDTVVSEIFRRVIWNDMCPNVKYMCIIIVLGTGKASIQKTANQCQGSDEDCWEIVHPRIYQLPTYWNKYISQRAGPQSFGSMSGTFDDGIKYWGSLINRISCSQKYCSRRLILHGEDSLSAFWTKGWILARGKKVIRPILPFIQ